MKEKTARWLDWIRNEELKAMLPYLEDMANNSGKLLEIGGGNGFLAKKLNDIGFQVVSIDPEPRQPSFFPVQQGNGSHLEFEDNSFDIIFSSNVLEHVVGLSIALREMKRVLKPGGLMMHSMPTPFNTLLTMLTQPKGYFRGLWFLANQFVKLFRFSRANARSPSENSNIKIHESCPTPSLRRRQIITALRMISPHRLFVSLPHGTSPSCFAEMREWKVEAWCRTFEQEGLCVKKVVNLPLAYSRHAFLPFRFISIRRRLACTGRTSCVMYLIQN